MKQRNTVEFVVYGRYALFSDPITRVGGEKFSYQIPTYQSLKGILESVYWKPTLIWYIDKARVMNKIQTQSKGIKPILYMPEKKNTKLNELSYYTYLKDVRYKVRAHFEWNENRPELAHDRDDNKHHNIAKRMIERGGRRDIFLGTRECQGYVEPCVFCEGEGFYDNYGELNFGVMVHGFDYPDETGRDEMSVRLWRSAKMVNGFIEFPRPDEDSPEILRRFIKPMKAKTFKDNRDFSGLAEEELAAILAENGGDRL
ncbi:type I-C CRISPR-associated protein Cas5 [Synergistales bacterium]|nr:type I-C CRISPR-associated protein Cas5 [Synergistales bacterium]